MDDQPMPLRGREGEREREGWSVEEIGKRNMVGEREEEGGRDDGSERGKE